jgi:hypothetical protein
LLHLLHSLASQVQDIVRCALRLLDEAMDNANSRAVDKEEDAGNAIA